jgi:hypothetical protein
MHLKQLCGIQIALVCLLLVGSTLPFTIETASAQTTFYSASVKPATPNSTIYLNVGQNCDISFEALWTYGDTTGQAIEYANVTVEVKTAEGAVTDMMLANTTAAGFADFNYSSSTPQILTFTPTSLVTPDGKELNASLLQDGETALYGLQSEPVTVYWDTFDVALVSTNTKTLEAIQVSVNVTYLLVPEEGLTIQSPDNSQQEFFPKIAHGVNITINGVTAEETSVPGVYNANVSTWMPTAYVIMKVSQEGWATAHKAFSFTHNANMTVWKPLAMIFALAYVSALSAVLFVSSRKSKSLVSKRDYLPVFGGFLLILASVIGLYWVLVWFESASHGFEWTLYWLLGVFSFGFGFSKRIMSVRRQKQVAVLLATSYSILANVIAVKASLDAYQLAIPWTLLLATFAFSVISGLSIGNSDNQFRT